MHTDLNSFLILSERPYLKLRNYMVFQDGSVYLTHGRWGSRKVLKLLWWNSQDPYKHKYGGIHVPRYRSWYNDSLLDGHPKDQIPERARISTPAQTGPGAHPASCTMGTMSLCPRVKQLGHGIDHLPPSCAAITIKVELYVYSLCVPSRPVLGQSLLLCFTFYGVLH